MLGYIIIHILSIIIGMYISRLMMTFYRQLRYEENRIRTKKSIRVFQVCALLGPVGLMAYGLGFTLYAGKIIIKDVIEDVKEIWK